MDKYRYRIMRSWLERITELEVEKVHSLEDKLTQVTGKHIKKKIKKELEVQTSKTERLCDTLVNKLNTNIH